MDMNSKNLKHFHSISYSLHTNQVNGEQQNIRLRCFGNGYFPCKVYFISSNMPTGRTGKPIEENTIDNVKWYGSLGHYADVNFTCLNAKMGKCINKYIYTISFYLKKKNRFPSSYKSECRELL